MLTNLRLQHFRSYKDGSFEFEPGVNVVVGPNASGKTNLLEAILMLARGRSYRAGDLDLIQYNKPWARLDADVDGQHRTVKIEAAETRAAKTYEIDGKSYSRLPTAQMLPVVVFEPNHLAMLGGTPDLRRTFIDDLAGQLVPGYETVLRQYRRTLAQRNRLLKTGQQSAQSQLFAWDIRLSQLGAEIVTVRQQTIKRLNTRLSKTYSDLAQKPSKLVITYSNAVEPASYASHLLRRYEQQRELDFIRGFTGAGPHREDLIFTLNKQALAPTASRGETRTTLLALKIIELGMIEERRGQSPLLLLDDVFSELDGVRRKALTETMQQHQTFITTTDADVVTHNFAQKANLIALS